MEDFYQYNNALCNVWRCTHDLLQISTYPYPDKRVNVVNYYSKATDYAGLTYNVLELFFNEVVCIIYPYLNNIYSQYIGFQHYRRAFSTIHIKDFHDLDNKVEFFCLAPYHQLERQCKGVWYLTDEMYATVLEFLNNFYPQIIGSQQTKPFFIQRNIFLTSYNIYKHIAQFYLRYINFIRDKYNLGTDPEIWKEHIYKSYVLPNKDRHMWYTQTFFEEDMNKNHPFIFRIYSYVLEFLAGLYMQTYFDTIRYGDFMYDPRNGMHTN